MDQYGSPFVADFNRTPRTADLFDDPDFWRLLTAARDEPNSTATVCALADFVQDQGFDRTCKLLRNDSQSAIRLLPTKSMCPSTISRRVRAGSVA